MSARGLGGIAGEPLQGGRCGFDRVGQDIEGDQVGSRRHPVRRGRALGGCAQVIDRAKPELVESVDLPRVEAAGRSTRT